MVRAVVLADTHVRRGSTRALPATALAELAQADVILHAGDVLIPDLIASLRELAPVHAVLGNNDHELVGVLPETLVVDLDGVSVAMIHDSGPTKGRAARMRRRFPSADIVVFGHSHQPCDEPGLDGQRLLNPGSPTERRMAPTHTLAIIEATAGKSTTRIVNL
jgi:putative phosphoesterase